MRRVGLQRDCDIRVRRMIAQSRARLLRRCGILRACMPRLPSRTARPASRPRPATLFGRRCTSLTGVAEVQLVSLIEYEGSFSTGLKMFRVQTSNGMQRHGEGARRVVRWRGVARWYAEAS